LSPFSPLGFGTWSLSAFTFYKLPTIANDQSPSKNKKRVYENCVAFNFEGLG
jgi:hypothetical protein